jgi:4-hydroxy-tetrahydrodipicolinate reductase
MGNGIMTIKILVNGSKGKMGQAVVEAVNNDADCELVAAIDHEDDLAAVLKQTPVDVAIDFTAPHSAYKNTKTIIAAGVHPVIGTTGFTLEQIQELQNLCQQKKLGGIIAPNFCLGVILMMHCSQLVSRYLPDVSIVELHHPHKLDAPAGTAKKTAEMIAAVRGTPTKVATEANPSLGLDYLGIPIHAIRLPGLVASQEVIFGGQAETLSIRHDTYNRTTYMPGVLLACKKVVQLQELIYGLEHIMEL